MSKHDADYFRQRRRDQGIPPPDSLQPATELHGVEQLPWPRNPFGEPATIAELLAEAGQLSEQIGENLNAAGRSGCSQNTISEALT